MRAKVFGIGMFKTGTSSLGEALELLGYRHSAEEWYHGVLFDDPWNTQPERWSPYIPAIVERARKFEAFQDYPWMYVYREMDQTFPGSRFVYTMRDPDRLAESNINHLKSRGHPEELLPSREKVIDRYLKHQAAVFEYFAGREHLVRLDWEAGDGWKKLCEFLGEPVPEVPFPHANKGRYSTGDTATHRQCTGSRECGP
jgi:hypothetical protein